MANKSVHDMDALASIAEDDCLYVEAGDGSDFGKVDVSVLRSEMLKQRGGANLQTGTTYTLALSDAGKVVELANASPITLTIPANSGTAFPVNTVIELVQGGAGAVTINITSDTLNGSTSISEEWGSVLLWKRAATEWVATVVDPSGLDESEVDARVELYQPASGTFNPTFQDSSFSDGEGQTHDPQLGVYRKTGDVCEFWIDLTATSLGTLTTGDPASIGNLPFTALAGSVTFSVHIGFAGNLNISAADALTAFIPPGTSRISLRKWSATTGSGGLTVGEVSADGRIVAHGSYIVAP